jgi:hypothetical protein
MIAWISDERFQRKESITMEVDHARATDDLSVKKRKN